jgi:hypothetical protein
VSVSRIMRKINLTWKVGVQFKQNHLDPNAGALGGGANDSKK